MPGKLTRSKISREIARNCRSSIKEGKDLLEITLNAMVRALSSGDRVEIRGFGVFAPRIRKERMSRNPRTGAFEKIESRRVLQFRPSKRLREALSGGTATRRPLRDAGEASHFRMYSHRFRASCISASRNASGGTSPGETPG